MISEKTKQLFQFIEYLHLNIQNFQKYKDIIVQIQSLDEQRNNLNRRENFVDKLKYDKIQTELEQKFDVIHQNITLPIYKKATELEIGYLNNQRFWQWGLSEIYNMKENFEECDIPEILLHKDKYIEFRESAHYNYFNDMFFRDLDRDLKEFFQFFSYSKSNEFEKFEAKTVKVESFEELIKHITKKKDTRFWITLFAEKRQNNIPEYKSYKSQIEQNGFFIVTSESNTVKFYTAELAMILTSQTFKCRNMDLQEETEINCFDYLKTYIAGYKEGEQYFEKEFNVSPNILYGINAEQYVKDIHLNFFHINHGGTHEGWGFVKKQIPVVLTHKIIKDYGFYSGIVSKVEAMVQKYPIQFETFDICEHQQPQQPEGGKRDEKYKNQYLFKVGLLFANGTMNKYFTINSKNETVMNSEFTAPKIAKELENESYNKYILASINNYTDRENRNKNIFNSLDMMKKIISHCEAKNIVVDAYFKSRLPTE